MKKTIDDQIFSFYFQKFDRRGIPKNVRVTKYTRDWIQSIFNIFNYIYNIDTIYIYNIDTGN